MRAAGRILCLAACIAASGAGAQSGGRDAATPARATQAVRREPAAPRFVAPVTGPVLQGFGAPGADGPASGVTFATNPSAPVASPCAGRVAFAAPFRSYGRLVIVACTGGTDMVLAGMGRLAIARGSRVRQGEALGRMPATPGRPTLYVELRAGARTIDPLPFLRARL